jgi:hypothetical protein
MASVTHRYNSAAMHAILKSPNGGLAKDMVKRGILVQNAAKRNLARHPHRINTGLLRASITWELFRWKGYPAVRVGSPLNYAIFVHNGTGLYGPKHDFIHPNHAKFLRFEVAGDFVFAKKVRGMPPNPFLLDALPFAKY